MSNRTPEVPLLSKELLNNTYRSYRFTVSTNEYKGLFIKLLQFQVEGGQFKGAITPGLESLLNILQSIDQSSAALHSICSQHELAAEIRMSIYDYTRTSRYIMD